MGLGIGQTQGATPGAPKHQPAIDTNNYADTTTYYEPDIKQQYPAYGWCSNEEADLDEDFIIDMPEYPDLRAKERRSRHYPHQTNTSRDLAASSGVDAQAKMVV